MPNPSPALAAAVRHANTVANSILRALKTASASGRIAEARSLQHAFFRSPDCKMACANEVWGRFGQPKRLTTILGIASRMDCKKPCHEPVVFHDKPKRSGTGHRRICTFGPEQTVRQIMVAKVLRATFQPPGYQYQHRGRGLAKAIRQVADYVTAGNSYAAVIDIKNCFDSFDPGKVPNLLPVSAVIAQNVLLMGGLNLTDGNRRPGAMPLHQRASRLQPAGCLPQGSVASSLVASILLSDLGEMIPAGCHLTGYVDDLVVLGPTKLAVDESVNALEAGLLEHRSGRLELKRRDTQQAESGFDFLGHRIAISNGAVCVQPSDENLDRIEQAFWSLAERLEDKLPFEECLRTLTRKIAAFPNWNGAGEYFEILSRAADYHRQTNEFMSQILGPRPRKRAGVR